MAEADPALPFYLIVTDHDRGFFAVEGPMTDDRPWNEAAAFARNQQRRIVCGPTGADRDALAAEYRLTHKLAGVPPGSIIRPLSMSMVRSAPPANRKFRPSDSRRSVARSPPSSVSRPRRLRSSCSLIPSM
jgi:hypothetical protein